MTFERSSSGAGGISQGSGPRVRRSRNLRSLALIWAAALGTAFACALPAAADPDACAAVDEFGLEGFTKANDVVARCKQESGTPGGRRTRGLTTDKSLEDGAVTEDPDSVIEAAYSRPPRRPRAIYILDERFEADEVGVYPEAKRGALIKAVKATAILTRVNKMADTPGGVELKVDKFTVKENSVFNARVPLCSGERFSDQVVGGFCTAFLVAPNVVATAGHCVNYEDVEDGDASPKAFRVVFGFEMSNGHVKDLIPSEQVFRAVSVRGLEKPNKDRSNPDFALLQLDRPVPKAVAEPLRMPPAAGLQLRAGDRLALIGHPSGLPKKISLNAASTAMDLSSSPHEFRAQLNAFHGNSGSPVVFYNEPDVVAGILVSGQNDFLPDASNRCVRSQVYQADSLCDRKRCSETATKIGQIAPYLP